MILLDSMITTTNDSGESSQVKCFLLCMITLVQPVPTKVY